MILRTATLASLFAVLSTAALAAPDAPALYAEHCAACHGDGRLGGTGPALIPEALGRMGAQAAGEVIAAGRAATQMPAFAETLAAEEIAALADWVRAPLPQVPDWTEADIAASLTPNPSYAPAAALVFEADPMNLFVVAETGDHHMSVLDGDRFEPIARFPPLSVEAPLLSGLRRGARPPLSVGALLLSGLRRGARPPPWVPSPRGSKGPLRIVDDLNSCLGPVIPHDMDRSFTMPQIVIGCDLSRAWLDVHSLPGGQTSRIVAMTPGFPPRRG